MVRSGNINCIINCTIIYYTIYKYNKLHLQNPWPSQVLGVLAYVITGSLQSKRCREMSCEDWEEARVSPVLPEGESEELEPVESHLSPWKGGEAANPGNYFREICRKVSASSRGFMKGKNLPNQLPQQGDRLSVCTTGEKVWEIVTQNNGQGKTRFLLHVIDSRNVYLA